MTAPARATANRPRRASTRARVISRRVGQGVSIGEHCHVHVAEIEAPLLTLKVTGVRHTSVWHLEVDESLQITAPDTPGLQRPGVEASPVEVRVADIGFNHVCLAVHAPRAIEVVRLDVGVGEGRAA